MLPPTAIFADNDMIALVALLAIREAGLRARIYRLSDSMILILGRTPILCFHPCPNPVTNWEPPPPVFCSLESKAM